MVIHWFTRYLTEYYSKNKKIGLDIGCGKRPYDKYFQCNYIGMDLPPNLAKKMVEVFLILRYLELENFCLF